MNETNDIPMTRNQAVHVVRLLRAEVIAQRTRAERLIHNTNMRQAGFNCIDIADELEELADTLDATFPEED